MSTTATTPTSASSAPASSPPAAPPPSSSPAADKYDWAACSKVHTNGLRVLSRLPDGFNPKINQDLDVIIPSVQYWWFSPRKKDSINSAYTPNGSYREIRFHFNGFEDPLKSIRGTLPFPMDPKKAANGAGEEKKDPNRPTLDVLLVPGSKQEQFAKALDKRTLEWAWVERQDWLPDQAGDMESQLSLKMIYRPVYKAPKSKDKSKDVSKFKHMFRFQITYEGEYATKVVEKIGEDPTNPKRWKIRKINTAAEKKKLLEGRWNQLVIDAAYGGVYIMTPNFGHRFPVTKIIVVPDGGTSTDNDEDYSGDVMYEEVDPSDAQPATIIPASDAGTKMLNTEAPSESSTSADSSLGKRTLECDEESPNKCAKTS